MKIASLEELAVFARELYERKYRYFLLEGELWAGKTQFVKAFVDSLGGDPHAVQSPTYTYMNIYHTPQGSVLHMDLYRLETEQDAFDRGIFEAIDSHDYICIERPKRQAHYVDQQWLHLHFQINADQTRTCTLSPVS